MLDQKGKLAETMAWRALVVPLKVRTDASDSGWGCHSSVIKKQGDKQGLRDVSISLGMNGWFLG